MLASRLAEEDARRERFDVDDRRRTSSEKLRREQFDKDLPRPSGLDEEAASTRAARSWIPTIVQPMGHAALPMAKRMYWSAALMYSRFLQSRTISARFTMTPLSRFRCFSPFSRPLL